MKKKLKIGLAYDVKEDYEISSGTWKHCDFSTLRTRAHGIVIGKL